MATIACTDCNGAGKLKPRIAFRFNHNVEFVSREIDCPGCAATGEIDIDKADDRDVITALRGVHPYDDDQILSAVIRKLGNDAFSYAALEMIADQYRASQKRRESGTRSNRAHHAAQQAGARA